MESPTLLGVHTPDTVLLTSILEANSTNETSGRMDNHSSHHDPFPTGVIKADHPGDDVVRISLPFRFKSSVQMEEPSTVNLPKRALTLTSMPDELIARTVKLANAGDLPALHLTSKRMRNISARRFAEVDPTKLHFAMTRTGARDLLDICQSTFIGHHLSTIVMDPKCLVRPSQRVGSYVASSKSGASGHTCASCLSFEKQLKEQHELVKTGEALHLLTSALRTIKARGKDVDVYIQDRSPSLVQDDVTWNSTSKQHEQCWKRDRTRSLQYALTAASESGCKIRKLSITISEKGSSYDTNNWDQGNILIRMTTMKHLYKVCPHIQTIQFHLDRPSYGHYMSTFRYVGRLVRHCTGLKTLDLGFGAKHKDWNEAEDPHTYPLYLCFREATKLIDLESLTVLRLYQFLADEDDLLDLLERHSDTIRDLELRDCALGFGGRWSFVLAWTQDHLTLDSLQIADLWLTVGQERESWVSTWQRVSSEEVLFVGPLQLNKSLVKEMDLIEHMEELHEELIA